MRPLAPALAPCHGHPGASPSLARCRLPAAAGRLHRTHPAVRGTGPFAARRAGTTPRGRGQWRGGPVGRAPPGGGAVGPGPGAPRRLASVDGAPGLPRTGLRAAGFFFREAPLPLLWSDWAGAEAFPGAAGF